MPIKHCPFILEQKYSWC